MGRYCEGPAFDSQRVHLFAEFCALEGRPRRYARCLECVQAMRSIAKRGEPSWYLFASHLVVNCIFADIQASLNLAGSSIFERGDVSLLAMAPCCNWTYSDLHTICLALFAHLLSNIDMWFSGTITFTMGRLRKLQVGDLSRQIACYAWETLESTGCE
jgi:hypothetical protein